MPSHNLYADYLFIYNNLSDSNILYWDNPSKMGTYDPSCDCYHGWTWGWNAYFSHYHLNSRSYLKNDDLILFVEFEGAPDFTL